MAGGALLAATPSLAVAFENRLLPDPGRLLYNALFFVAGAALADSGDLPDLTRLWPPVLGLSLVAFAATYWLLPAVASGEAVPSSRIFFGALYSATAWLTSLGLLGLATRFVRVLPAPAGALVDASYWVYLVHLPLVGAAHVFLSRASAPPLLSWGATILATLGVALPSWVLVRRTWIGKLLGTRVR
jgi:hypothetical protein